MYKLIATFLLIVFCINIFGAGIGELVHMIAHTFQDTDFHIHTHHSSVSGNTEHYHIHSHPNVEHHHNEIIEFLLNTFEMKKADTPINNLVYLNLLMLVLDGYTPDQLPELRMPDEFHAKVTTSTTFLKTSILKVPTPPPRLLA